MLGFGKRTAGGVVTVDPEVAAIARLLTNASAGWQTIDEDQVAASELVAMRQIAELGWADLRSWYTATHPISRDRIRIRYRSKGDQHVAAAMRRGDDRVEERWGGLRWDIHVSLVAWRLSTEGELAAKQVRGGNLVLVAAKLAAAPPEPTITEELFERDAVTLQPAGAIAAAQAVASTGDVNVSVINEPADNSSIVDALRDLTAKLGTSPSQPECSHQRLFPSGVPDDPDLVDCIVYLDSHRGPLTSDRALLRNWAESRQLADPDDFAKKMQDRIRKARNGGKTTLPSAK